MNLSFTTERFEDIAAQAEATKRSLPRYITTNDAYAFLQSLTEKIHTFAVSTIETIKDLPPGVNAGPLIQPQLNSLKSSIEKHFADIDKGIEPYTIYRDRVHAFTLLEPLYKKFAQPSHSHQTTWKEQALRIEQELLHEDYHEDYIAHLHAIADLTQSDAFLSTPNLYICYAWPTLENIQEAWIPSFLQKLASDLESAGMVVFMNTQKLYNSSDQNKILTVDHVPLIGSPSLLKKSQKDIQVLGELKLIKQRIQAILDTGSSLGRNPALPLLICGTQDTAFPPEIASLKSIDFSGNESQHDNRSSYLFSLKNLLEYIYAVPQQGQAKQNWENLWANFFEKFPALEQGLVKSVVEKYAKGEQTRHSKQQFLYENLSAGILTQHVPAKVQSPPLPLLSLSRQTIIDGLISYYQTKNKIPNILGKPLAIDQHYTELVIVKEKKRKEKDFEKKETEKGFEDNRLSSWEDVHRPKEPIELEKLFAKRSDEKKDPKHILLTGRAGIGKSTLCQYIAYQWAHEKLWTDRFDAVFWVPLRDLLTQKEEDPYQALIQCCFTSKQKRKLDAPSLENFVKEQHEKILFILDGYDEISASLKPGSKLYDLLQELLEQKNWILTSRPYATHNIIDIHQTTIDRKIENVGFTNEGIETFAQKYFPQDLNNRFLQQLRQNPSVFGSAHVPLNLGLICSVWESHQNKTTSPFSHLTMTALYEKLTNVLLHRSLKKLDIDDSEWLERDFETDLTYSSAARFLEELAWNGLDQENIILSFKNEHLKEIYLKHCPDQQKRNEWKRIFLNLGFLISSGQCASFMDNEYYFIHLTFQEFFAAKHIKRLMQNDPEKAREIITDYKFIPRYQVVWWFLAGLLKNDKVLLNQYFWLIDHPRDLIGPHRIGLIIRCLEECECSDLLHTKEALLDDVRDWAKLMVELESGEGPTKWDFHFLKNLNNLFQLSPTLCRLTYIDFILKRLKEVDGYSAAKLLNLLGEIGAYDLQKVISALSKAAHYEDRYAWRAALTALARIGQHHPKKIIPFLLKIMSEKTGEIKERSIVILGDIGHNECEKVVLELLNSATRENHNLLEALFGALSKIGQHSPKTVVPALIKATNDQDINIRKKAFEALGNIGQHDLEQVIPVLLKSVANRNASVRKTVVTSLGKIGSYAPEKVIPALLKTAKDSKESVRIPSIEFLGAIGHSRPEQVIPILSESSNHERIETARTAVQALSRISEHFPEQVIPVLIKRCSNRSTRNESVQALGNIGKHDPEKVVPVLVETSLDMFNSRETRHFSVEALGKIGRYYPERVLPALLANLKDCEFDERVIDTYISTFIEISHYNTKKTVELIANSIKEANGFLLLAYTEFLAYNSEIIDFELVAPILLKNLNYEFNESVRTASAYGLGCISQYAPEKILTAILIAVKDKSPDVRNAAAGALGKLSKHIPEKVAPILLQNMKNEDPNIRKASAEALGEIQLDTYSQTISALSEARKDPSSSVRKAAIEALAKIGSLYPKKVLPLLLESNKDGNVYLKEATNQAIVRMIRSNPSSMTTLDSSKLVSIYLESNISLLTRNKSSLAVIDNGLHIIKIPHAHLKAAQITNECYEILFPKKSARAHLEKARAFEQEEAYDKALMHYQEAAKLASPDAFYKLGKWYKEGTHVQQSLSRAKRYLQDADIVGHPDAKQALVLFKNPAQLLRSFITEPRKERIIYLLKHHLRISLFSKPIHLQALCTLCQNKSPFSYTQILTQLFDTILAEIDVTEDEIDTWKQDALPQLESAAWNLLTDPKKALNVPLDPILKKTKWISGAMGFTFLPVQEYLAARWLHRRLQTSPNEAIELIENQSLNPRLLYVWPIVAGLSQSPIVLHTLRKDLFLGHATPLHIFCLEEYTSCAFAKEHLKQIQQETKKALSSKGLTWSTQKFIQALTLCPKVMEAANIHKWTFPIKKASLVPLSAAWIAHDPSSINSLIKDLNHGKRQHFACMVVAQSGLFNEEFIAPILKLLTHTQKKTCASASQALIAMANSAPNQISVHLQNPVVADILNAKSRATDLSTRSDKEQVDTLKLPAEDNPKEEHISELLHSLNDTNAEVRHAAALLLSKADLSCETFSWSILSDESKPAFQGTPLNLLPLLSKLDTNEQLKLLVYLLAQDVHLTYENSALYFFDPTNNVLQHVKVSEAMIAEFKGNYTFLTSIPKSLFQWARTKEKNQEQWSYVEIPSGIEILTTQHIAPERLQSLEKSLISWLGKNVESTSSSTSMLISTKNIEKLKLALELFGIAQKSSDLSTSLSSESLSSDEEDSGE